MKDFKDEQDYQDHKDWEAEQEHQANESAKASADAEAQNEANAIANIEAVKEILLQYRQEVDKFYEGNSADIPSINEVARQIDALYEKRIEQVFNLAQFTVKHEGDVIIADAADWGKLIQAIEYLAKIKEE
jgi:hypothetical protein